MTLAYAPKPGTGDLLYVLRLVFSCTMVASLVLGLTASRRRDIVAHRAWMVRPYAIGLAFTEGEVRDDLAKGDGWVINLAVAEWAIRRRTTPGKCRGRRPRPTTSLTSPEGASS